MNIGGVSTLTFATTKNKEFLTNNRSTMLLKTFIHQECHVIKKSQMESNLKPHKKKKTN